MDRRHLYFLTLRFCGAEELRSANTPHPGHFFTSLPTLATIDVHSDTSAETRNQVNGVSPNSSHHGSPGLGPAHQCGGLRSHEVPEP